MDGDSASRPAAGSPPGESPGASNNRHTTTVYCMTCGLQRTPTGRPTSAQAIEQTRPWFEANCRGAPLQDHANEPGMRCDIRTGRET